MELGDGSMSNRLRNFLGKRPVEFNGVGFYSPTIDSIDEIGETVYSVYLALATFDKELILKHVFQLSDEDYAALESSDDYFVLTTIPATRMELCNALSFFTKSEVVYVSESNAYAVNDVIFLTQENYKDAVKIIKEQNGVFDEEKEVKKYRNKKAEEVYQKLLKERKKLRASKKDDSLSLKDVLSILCNAEGNGINIFNVGQLTIYQVYEHFDRLNLKEQHKRLLKVWANGYLDQNTTVPEWIVRSKI